MKRDRAKVWLLFVALVLWTLGGMTSFLFTQEPGRIEGLILSPEGKPVAGATVSALELSHPFVGRVPTSLTDQNGHFLIDGLEAGPYMLYAGKEEENYPETNNYFYGPDPPREVTVHEGRVTKNVVLRLGPKGARLRGRVVDAETTKTISNASMSLVREDDSAASMGSSVGKAGEFNALVPGNKPFRLKVSAPGYHPWYFGTDGTEEHAAPIEMKPGESKELTIRLKPIPKKPELDRGLSSREEHTSTS